MIKRLLGSISSFKSRVKICYCGSEGESKELIKKVRARFDAANQKTFKIIEDFIAGGYEENLARLLVYLPKERREASLQKLPENVRKKVSSILNTFSEKKNSDPDIMSAVGTLLKNADFDCGEMRKEK